MNRRLFRGIILMALLGLALAFIAKTARAESSVGVTQATARLTISVTVLPVTRILEQKQTPQGTQVTLWTNMPSIDFNGQTFRFDRVGQQVVTIPSTTITTDNFGTSVPDGQGFLTMVSP